MQRQEYGVTDVTYIYIILAVSCSLIISYLSDKYYTKRFDEKIKNIYRIYICSAAICGMVGFLYSTDAYGYGITKAIRYFVLIAALIMLGKIDNLKLIIPNGILIFLIIVRTIILVTDLIEHSSFAFLILSSAGLGIIYGSIVFLIVRLFAKKSIGMGDIKLLAVVGYYLGSTSIIPALVVSLIIAAVYSLIMLIRKKMTLKDTFSFAPYIAAGTIIILTLGV